MLDVTASDKDDEYEDPRLGKVGKQVIKDTDPLTTKSGWKRLRTKDDSRVQIYIVKASPGFCQVQERLSRFSGLGCRGQFGAIGRRVRCCTRLSSKEEAPTGGTGLLRVPFGGNSDWRENQSLAQ